MQIISKCGNRCDLCMLYEQNIGRYGGEAVKAKLRQYYDYEPPENVACAGCHNEGCHPSENCAIRKCCVSRGHENCAGCEELICGLLQTNIQALNTLINTHKDISGDDFDLCYRPYINEPVLMELKQRRNEDD